MQVRIVLCGFGNVGQCFAKVIEQKGPYLQERYGLQLALTGVLDSSGAAIDRNGLDPAALLEAKQRHGGVASYPGCGYPGMESAALVCSSGAHVLVEATPTNMDHGEPGLSNIRQALESGMHVASASKGALVLSFRELTALARERGLALKFAAAVASPLPTLELAEYSLQGCEIRSMEAILNATSNCILSYMETGAGSFDEALKEAQRLGIAEANPRLDVEGWDTAGKMVILANALMGEVSLSQVERRGVDTVTPEMVATARDDGRSIKLLGTARRTPAGLELKVLPVALPPEHPLYHVKGSQKGITLDTDLAGRLTVADNGTGPMGTAAAVLRDVVNIARFHMGGVH